MRIAVFHNQPSGGARRALHGFCRELRGDNSRSGNSIDVFTLSTADSEWLRDQDVADNVFVHELKREKPVRFGLYLNDLLRRRDLDELERVNAEIARAIDAGGYDVVLVDICRFTLVPAILSSLRTPSVFYAHNGPARLEGGEWDSPQTRWAAGRDLWHRPFLRAHERRIAGIQEAGARAATQVVANSQHTARRMRIAFGVDAVACPPGVELPPTSSFPRAAPPGTLPIPAPYVLSVGEIEPRKGFLFLVDAIGRVPAEIRPRLRILANRANPVERDHLEARSRELGVYLDVVVDPPQRELWRTYDQAEVFVYAAHNEALGLAPLEAMARAVPVVAVAEGGVTETVTDASGFLTRRDPGDFARRLTELLTAPTERVRLGAGGRQLVEQRWSWPERAAALDDVLATVANTVSGRAR